MSLINHYFYSNFRYVNDVLSLNNLSKRGWSKWYYKDSKVCSLSWPSSWNLQKGKIKTETLRQNDDFTLLSQLPFQQ